MMIPLRRKTTSTTPEIENGNEITNRRRMAYEGIYNPGDNGQSLNLSSTEEYSISLFQRAALYLRKGPRQLRIRLIQTG